MTIKGEYGQSARGNFKVIDTIGVPHTYCITPKHIEYSDGMYLDIEGAEKRGAVCDTCREIKKRTGKPILTHAQHETALLVECKIDANTDAEGKKELHAWLLSIKDEATRNKYAGFAFIKSKGVGP